MNIRQSVTHSIKTDIPYFESVYCGEKNYELRLNDRDYRVGDTLLLQEYDRGAKTFTGRFCVRVVDYIYVAEENDGFGLMPGYCIMSWKVAK